MFISRTGVLKIGDFGLSSQLKYCCLKRNWYCSLRHMAPEAYGEGACLKSDVWSLGMSVIEMAEGNHPYVDMTVAEIVYAVLYSPSPSLSSFGWSCDLMDFVNKCLVKDIDERASVEELLKVRVSFLV